MSYGAYAVGGEVEKLEYPLIEGRMFTASAGTRLEGIIGLGLSRHLGLGVGDTQLIRLGSPSGPQRVMEIVGVYIEDSNYGRMLSFGLERATVELSGASRADLTVTDTIADIRASGASRLVYGGGPTIGSVSTSGASTIESR